MIEYIHSNVEKNIAVISIPPLYLGGAVRFQALHSVAFDPNDLTRLAPGNISRAMEMEKELKEWSQIDRLPGEEKMDKYLDFARRKQAGIAVIRNPVPEWLNADIVFSNQTYSLIRLE